MKQLKNRLLTVNCNRYLKKSREDAVWQDSQLTIGRIHS